MESSEAKLMPTASPGSTSTEEVTLQRLNDDVIWEILSYLRLRDLLMVDEAVPEWNHITGELLLKQQHSWCGDDWDIHRRPSQSSLEDEFEDENFEAKLFAWCDIRYPHRCVARYRQSYKKDSIPKKWLQTKSLAEWKLLLERCPNLCELYLYNLHDISSAHLVEILECILRLCKNLKSFAFHYKVYNSGVEKFVRKDMSKWQYRFNWIPSWGSEDQKQIFVTPQMLEPQSNISIHVIDLAKDILATIGFSFRDPYWFSMTFQRCTWKRENIDKCIVVAQLQYVTIGICIYKRNRSGRLWGPLMDMTSYDAWELRTDCGDFPIYLKTLPDDIETICSLLRQLDKWEEFERDLYSLKLFSNTENMSVIQQPMSHHCGCRCCSCMDCSGPYYCVCDRCKSQTALEKWNTHWKTVRKSDWDCNWTKYKDTTELPGDERNCGRYDIENCQDAQVAVARPGGKGRGFRRLV